jgi:hypothetical protein
VHKDFKKRGFGFTELQSGVMVCRPCHSAIHRAVPDNKELALHYRTLDALRQVGWPCLCAGAAVPDVTGCAGAASSSLNLPQSMCSRTRWPL